LRNDSFICIAHRGASGYAPENTLAAFELAIEMGCPWIELDVYALENEIIVIHDDDLDRTTNGTGAVTKSSVAHIRSLDAGDGEKVPTLLEVIELVNHRAIINIELKGTGTAGPVTRLLNRLCELNYSADEFFISSFNHKELAKMDNRYSRGPLFDKRVSDYIERAFALNAKSINVSARIVDAKMIAKAHENGLKVYVYTVNKQSQMAELKAMGVDGVFTNYPDLFPKNTVPE
jgi:glycerophosphoryl diester phosphodiesterase